MSTCYYCGGAIEFRYVGTDCIPFHPNGACTRSSSRYSATNGRSSPSILPISDSVHGTPITIFASFTDPNATCPICGARVFYYESPYGGRVFFDELGPPWPKHPCTDSGLTGYGYRWETRPFFIDAPNQSAHLKINTSKAVGAKVFQWQSVGWIPYHAYPTNIQGIGTCLRLDSYRNSASTRPAPRYFVINPYDSKLEIPTGKLTCCFQLFTHMQRFHNALDLGLLFVRQVSGQLHKLSTVEITPDHQVQVLETELIEIQIENESRSGAR
jgi:hypothetical protein